jgi:alkylhydroperoxidase/carboxymuconolactone decarboxylase family protein YurZ
MLAHVACSRVRISKAVNPFRNCSSPPEPVRQAARQSGPLDARTCRLVHLALAMAANSEGATHSHVRRGPAEGLTGDELEHVALLAVTTLGWPQAIRALNWIRDLTRPEGD